MKEIVVYIYLNDHYVPAGKLAFEQMGRYSHAIFRYGEQYLSHEYAIPLDPIQLPLIDSEIITPNGFEIFNGIRDAGPDRWGRYLLDKKYTHPLDELDYITLSSLDRVGALAFSDQVRSLDMEAIKRLDLKLCIDAAEQALSGESTPALQAYLDYGPSLGGARPKSTVMWNNKPYVAKFTLSMDKQNEALIEYATMSLAKKCGLNVPNIDKTIVSGRDIYLIQRFDRAQDHAIETPIPFISGLTATGFHEQDSQDWSYLSLCDAINRFSSDPEKDKIELYKRMVFNILVYNNDDHMRNHGFIYSGNQKWSLSPLFDVVPGIVHSETRMLAMKIGDRGKEASIENAGSAAKYFDISDHEAHHMIHSLKEGVHDWENHYRESGVSSQDIEKLRPAFKWV